MQIGAEDFQQARAIEQLDIPAFGKVPLRDAEAAFLECLAGKPLEILPAQLQQSAHAIVGACACDQGLAMPALEEGSYRADYVESGKDDFADAGEHFGEAAKDLIGAFCRPCAAGNSRRLR